MLFRAIPSGFTVVEVVVVVGFTVVVVGFTVVDVVVVGFTVVGGVVVTTGFTVVGVAFGAVTGTRAGATTVVVGATVVDVVVVGATVVDVVTGTFGARGTSATLLRRLTDVPIDAVIQQCDSQEGGIGTTAMLAPLGNGYTLARSMRMIDSAFERLSVSSSLHTRRLRAHSMR